MAIAFNAAADGGNNGGASASLTFSYTCSSGANRLLCVGIAGDTTTDDVTGVTYNGIAMTLAVKEATAAFNLRMAYLYYLLVPASGANNVVISASSTHYIIAGAADYTGVSALNANTNNTAAGTSLTTSITTTADNSWTVLVENSYNANAAPTAGTGSTRRTFDAAFGGWGLFDSGGLIHPAGSYSMTTANGSGNVKHAVASFSPSGVSAGSLRYNANMDGLGASGPFFSNPLARIATVFGWRKGLLIPVGA